MVIKTRVIDSDEVFNMCIEEMKLQHHVYFDTETDAQLDKEPNPYTDKVLVMAFGWMNEKENSILMYILDFTTLERATLERYMQGIYASFRKMKRIYAHNIKYDLHVLKNSGFPYENNNLSDGMTFVRLTKIIDNEYMRLGLKIVSKDLFGLSINDDKNELDAWYDNAYKAYLRECKHVYKNANVESEYTHVKVSNLRKDAMGVIPYNVILAEEYIEQHLPTVTYALAPKNLLYKYCAYDVVRLILIIKIMSKDIKKQKLLKILNNEDFLIKAVYTTENAGLTIDMDKLAVYKYNITNALESVRDYINTTTQGAFTCGQHQKIKKYFLDQYGMTLGSTDEKSLKQLAQKETIPEEAKELISMIVYNRGLEKAYSTYIYRFEQSIIDGKLYSTFNPNGTVTGRFSSNLQQFPRDGIFDMNGNELVNLRRLVVPSDKDHVLAFIDYAQMELRLQAHYTYIATNGVGDVQLLRAYVPFRCYRIVDGAKVEFIITRDNNIIKNHDWYRLEDDIQWIPTDIHSSTTLTAFPRLTVDSDEFKKLRSVGKRINFEIMYGSGLKACQETHSDIPPDTVRKLYYGFFQAFPAIKVYQLWLNRLFSNLGYAENAYGRRYRISDDSQIYKLYNWVIQGTGADILKQKINAVYKLLRNYKTKMIAYVHDEIIFDVPKDEIHLIARIKEIMEDVPEIVVPMAADASISETCWKEKHELL